MTSSNNHILDFGSGLNLLRAEEAALRLEDLAPNVTDVTLDLSRCRHVDIGAAWRLGNLLRPLAEAVKITVHVPDDADLRSVSFFKLFTHSSLGFSIRQYASRIRRKGEDITTEFRDYYARPRSDRKLPIDAWSSTTFLFVPNLLSATLPPDSQESFSALLRDLLPPSRFDPTAYSRPALRQLFQLLYEAVQNVWDHADRLPFPEGTSVQSSLSVRYFKSISPPKSFTSELRPYLRRVEGAVPENTDYIGFLEFVVVDDGVGVAARFSGDVNIYSQSFSDETSSLDQALAQGHSVKLRSRDAKIRGTPGYGFAKITKALEELAGFALLRTGRSLAYFDSTSPTDTFVTLAEPLGVLPGTALQILIPCRKRRVWDV